MSASATRLILIGLFMAPLISTADSVRCENLFFNESEVQSAVEGIARFRMEAIALHDTKEKKNQLDEADKKIVELGWRIGDFERARRLLADAQARLTSDHTRSKAEEKRLHQEKQGRMEIEQEKLLSWRYILKIHFQEEIRRLDLSPDGAKILVLFSDHFKLFDAKTLTPIEVNMNPTTSSLKNASFSGDGKKLILTHKTQLIEIDMATLQSKSEDLTVNLNTRFLGFKPSADASSLLVQEGKTYSTYNRKSKTLHKLIEAGIALLSKNGDEVFLVNPGIKKFDLKDGTEIPFPQAEDLQPSFAALTPDKENMVLIEGDQLHLLNLNSNTRVTWPIPDLDNKNVANASFSRDGSQVAINCKLFVLLLNLQTGHSYKLPHPERTVYTSTAFSDDGSLLGLTTQDGLFSMPADKPDRLLKMNAAQVWNDDIQPLPENRGFISADKVNNLFIWFREAQEGQAHNAELSDPH